uniref:Pro-neuregulin-4, membrane-bound isoform n=1 Tax=Bos taurus TaxID=9913 RepID=A0A3Q1LMH2_BOVIN
MTTDHEEPCGPSHRSFCLNGGLCYVIPTIPSPFCRCIENYTGARCEEVFLPSSSIQTKSDLFTAFVALTVLLGTLILGALYFLCREHGFNSWSRKIALAGGHLSPHTTTPEAHAS